ncbi:MAG: hypothetical protein K2H01_02120 [Ruminococcus sp.]|nr:hypothetical protein [Ruminococcus sp.]
MANTTLTHHGIKGMRWGVRRYQNKDGSLTNNGKKHYDNLGTQSISKRGRKKDCNNRRKLTDDQLKKKIERLKMEKEFKQLSMEDISPGKQYVKKILSSAGTKSLTVAASGAMSYAIKGMLTKEWDAKEAAKYVGANPNQKK